MSIEKRIKIITPQERVAIDPRGTERMTIVGGMIFRTVEISKNEATKTLGEVEDELEVSEGIRRIYG